MPYPVPGPERRRAPSVLTTRMSVDRAPASLSAPAPNARATVPAPTVLRKLRRVTDRVEEVSPCIVMDSPREYPRDKRQVGTSRYSVAGKGLPGVRSVDCVASPVHQCAGVRMAQHR